MKGWLYFTALAVSTPQSNLYSKNPSAAAPEVPEEDLLLAGLFRMGTVSGPGSGFPVSADR